MDYILRKAKSDDIIRIEELFIEMLKTIYNTDDIAGYETGYLDKFFSDKEDWICVAEDEGEVVAFLSIEVYREKNYIYLDDLSVAENYRNKGIGTKLIRVAEKYASEIGIAQIIFHVEKTNENAYHLYARLGYSKYANEGNRICMSKSIK